MKNKKLLTLAALAGLTIGGVSVATAASAQSYGGQQDAPAAESTSETTETGGQGNIVEVQDAEGSEAPEDGERRGRRGHRGGCNLEEAAEAIGIEEADLSEALDGGATIAEVAAANGVDADAVIDAMVDAKEARIAEKVEEGRITQERADEKLADVEARITDRVNGVEDAVRT